MASPSRFWELLGLELIDDGAEGSPGVALEIGPQHRNLRGTVHGSVIHAVLDTAMGIQCFRRGGGKPVATAELTVRYLRPVHGGRIEARARIVHLGRRMIVAEGTARRLDDGAVVAIAHGTFVQHEPGSGRTGDGSPRAE